MICPHCKKTKYAQAEGNIYCENCGLIVKSNYNYTAGFKINLRYGKIL